VILRPSAFSLITVDTSRDEMAWEEFDAFEGYGVLS